MDCSLPASRIRAIARTGEGPPGVPGAAQVRGLLAGKCSGRSEPPRSASLYRNQDLGPWRHGRPGSAPAEVLGLWGPQERSLVPSGPQFSCSWAAVGVWEALGMGVRLLRGLRDGGTCGVRPSPFTDGKSRSGDAASLSGLGSLHVH